MLKRGITKHEDGKVCKQLVVDSEAVGEKEEGENELFHLVHILSLALFYLY